MQNAYDSASAKWTLFDPIACIKEIENAPVIVLIKIGCFSKQIQNNLTLQESHEYKINWDPNSLTLSSDSYNNKRSGPMRPLFKLVYSEPSLEDADAQRIWKHWFCSDGS